MNGEILYWWLGLLGSVASLIGLPIAIWQIYKTRRAAEAATVASLQTRKVISRNLLISDVSNSMRHIEEIRLYIRGENFELALVRVNDLNSNLIQIQKILESSVQAYETDFVKIYREIKKIRIDLRNTVEDNSRVLSRTRIDSQLDIISDSLNKLIGETKILIEKGS